MLQLWLAMCSIDTDVVIHDDMYKHLKGPLFGNLTWICGDDDYQIGEQWHAKWCIASS